MSLVHEALQKAEREKQRKAGNVVEPPPAIRTAPAPAAHRAAATAPAKKKKSVLLWVVVLFIGVWGVLFAYLHKPTPVVREWPATPPSQVQPATAPVAPAPVAAPVEAGKFVVTGIMQDADGKFMAVLNGRPVSEGQFVDGALVKRVERDRVIVEVNGRESTVPFNR